MKLTEEVRKALKHLNDPIHSGIDCPHCEGVYKISKNGPTWLASLCDRVEELEAKVESLENHLLELSEVD